MIACAERPTRLRRSCRAEIESPPPPDELPPEEPSDLEPPPDEPSDLEFEDFPCTDDDDSRWEAFVPDDDERDPEPAPGDFWID